MSYYFVFVMKRWDEYLIFVRKNNIEAYTKPSTNNEVTFPTAFNTINWYTIWSYDGKDRFSKIFYNP